MSEQNQMAISPVTAGLVGAGVGACNYFVGLGAKQKEGYRDAKELLTLKDDEFKKLAEAVKKDGDEAAKTEFKKLEDGRTTVSSAGDALVKEQATARKDMKAAIEKAVADGKISGLDVTAETNNLTTAQTELANAKKPLTDALADTGADKLGKLKADAKAELTAATEQTKIDALKADESKQSKELKDLIAKEKAETDAAKKAELTKQVDAQAKKDLVAELKKKNDSAISKYQAELKNTTTDELKGNIKTKATDVNAKKTALFEKNVAEAEKAIGENPTDAEVKTLKDKMKGWKETLAKKADDIKKAEVDKLVGENGALKDLDTGKFKKFLPKGKMIPALIGAGVLGAAGVALSYIVGPKNSVPTDVA